MKAFIRASHFSYLTWMGRALLLGSICYFLLWGTIREVAITFIFFILSFLPFLYKKGLPPLYSLLLILSLLLNTGGWVWDAYDTIWFYDELAHFFTLFVMTLSIGHIILTTFTKVFVQHRYFILLTILSFGLSIGALWEIWEWIADFFVSKEVMSGLNDTILDLIWDSAGALLATFFFVFFGHKIAQYK